MNTLIPANKSKKNEYLRSLLSPYGNPARVPDLDMTTSEAKSLNLTATVQVPDTGAGLFWYRPHTHGWVVRHFIWDNVNLRYVNSEPIFYDEEIADNFSSARFVSGALQVKSSTRSGGTIDISGTFNAVAVQELPDLSKLSFRTIGASKRNDRDVKLGVNIEDGILALAHPEGNHTFAPFDTYSVAMMTKAMLWLDTKTHAPTLSQGWAQPNATNGGVVFDSDLVPGWVPPNFDGHIEVSAKFHLKKVVNPAVSVKVEVIFHGLHKPTIGPSTAVTASFSCEYAFPAVTNSEVCMPIIEHDLIPFPVDRVTVLFSGYATLTDVEIEDATLSVRNWCYYQEGYLGPGTLIAYDGIDPSSKLTLHGVGNFEVVPNAELAKQLTTHYWGIENPMEMEFAEAFINQMGKYGLTMVWNANEYRSWILSGAIERYLEPAFLAEASGFTDFLKKVWSTVKTVAPGVLPVVGGLLGGPEGAMLGNIAGRAIARSASYGRPLYEQATSSAFINTGEGYGTASNFNTGYSASGFAVRTMPNLLKASQIVDLEGAATRSIIANKERLAIDERHDGLGIPRDVKCNPLCEILTAESVRRLRERQLAQLVVKYGDKENFDQIYDAIIDANFDDIESDYQPQRVKQCLPPFRRRGEAAPAASLIGDETWSTSARAIVSTFSGPEPFDPLDYENADYPLILVDNLGWRSASSQNAAEAMKAAQAGTGYTKVPVWNIFPIVASDRKTVMTGSAIVSRHGLLVSNDDGVYLRLSKLDASYTLLIYSEAEVKGDVLTAIMLAAQSAADRGYLGYQATISIALMADVPFMGGSFGYALYASLLNRALPGFCSGAVSTDRLFMPNDIDVKTKYAIKVKQNLFVVAEEDDPLSDDVKMIATAVANGVAKVGDQLIIPRPVLKRDALEPSMVMFTLQHPSTTLKAPKRRFERVEIGGETYLKKAPAQAEVRYKLTDQVPDHEQTFKEVLDMQFDPSAVDKMQGVDTQKIKQYRDMVEYEGNPAQMVSYAKKLINIKAAEQAILNKGTKVEKVRPRERFIKSRKDRGKAVFNRKRDFPGLGQ